MRTQQALNVGDNPARAAFRDLDHAVLDAIRWDGTWQGHAEMDEWASELVETGQAQRPPQRPHGTVFVGDGTDLWVFTLEGPRHVAPGDWIVCGAQGEFYPVKPDIFAATYEPVEAPR